MIFTLDTPEKIHKMVRRTYDFDWNFNDALVKALYVSDRIGTDFAELSLLKDNEMRIPSDYDTYYENLLTQVGNYNGYEFNVDCETVSTDDEVLKSIETGKIRIKSFDISFSEKAHAMECRLELISGDTIIGYPIYDTDNLFTWISLINYLDEHFTPEKVDEKNRLFEKLIGK